MANARQTRKKGESLITDPRQMETLASPVRNRICVTLEMLGECTVGELGRWMGRTPETLYYHIRLLEAAGVVIQTGARPVPPREEALYALVKGAIRVDWSISLPRFLRAVAKGAATFLRHAERCFSRAIMMPGTRRHGPTRELRIEQITVRLDAKGMHELNRRWDEMLAFAREADDAGQKRSITLTIAMSPDPQTSN